MISWRADRTVDVEQSKDRKARYKIDQVDGRCAGVEIEGGVVGGRACVDTVEQMQRVRVCYRRLMSGRCQVVW